MRPPSSAMVVVAKLALLLLVAPAAPARCGAFTYKTFRAGRWSARQRPFALAKASSEDALGLAGPRTCSSRCLAQTSHERSAGSTESLRALSLVRGGGGGVDDDTPVFTLFVRVFVPSFGRESEAKKGELDLEGGGLMRRLGRLVSGVLRKVPGFSGSTKAKGEEAKTASKKKGKGKESSKSHLETTYRPGNANYRIQKELKEFMTNPPDNCKVSVGKNIRVWIITISGPEGTIYAGEKFRLRVAFPEDYPTKPPAVYFLQSPPPPKHQHIYTNGDICLSLLSSRDWKPNLTVMSLALSILSMLSSAKEKRTPEDNAAHADARPGQAQQWIYHDDLC